MAANPTTKNVRSAYDASSIQVLEGLEAVKRRPGMYIGSTGPRGLHHLVGEIVDNSIDEALAGYCSEVLIVVHPDNSVTVIDDGRGMPVGKMAKYGKSATEVILTTLHAGGKFDGQGYKVSGGLHGVGASVVNALSEWLEVEVRREGHVWSQRYELGFPKGSLTKNRKLKKGEGTGTTVSFLPDPAKPAYLSHIWGTRGVGKAPRVCYNHRVQSYEEKNVSGAFAGDVLLIVTLHPMIVTHPPRIPNGSQTRLWLK